MSKRHNFWALIVLPMALTAAWGQDSSAQQPADTAQSSPQPPVPAYGPDSTVPAVGENPPISGLDLPNLEPHAAPVSYLRPGAHFSEAVSSNLQNSLGGSDTGTITEALGSLDLQRLWSNYDLSLSYLGGVGYYSVSGIGLRQIQEMGLNQKITWKRGELGIRDAFSYQPEGTFGSSYGAIGTTNAGTSGETTFFGGTALGALGQVPRIMNLTLVDVVENLTPKSSITVTGGYGFVHFLGNDLNTGTAFIGNSQVSGQMGYDRVLGPHDQGALVYGYQGFQFSTGVTFHSHVIQLMWGHRISGRMDFLVGAGPQFTQLNHVPTPITNPTQIPADTSSCFISQGQLECPLNDFRISAAGRASLRYRFPRVSLDLTYDHYITGGSGFFAGAESDIARLTANRPLNRVWTASADIGYSRNSRVLPLTAGEAATCSAQPGGSACPGVSANTYQYEFAGVAIHRMLGRNFHVFGSYQFDNLAFDKSYCGVTVPCDRISQRQVGTIGLDWIPRPIRID